MARTPSRISDLSEDALEILSESLSDLPSIDLSLHIKLPELIAPELQRLRDAVAEDDPTAAGTSCAQSPDRSTPLNNVHLAETIVQLRDQRRLTRTQAAYAIYELNTQSQHLIAASVTHTVAVAVGASRTPSGLQIAA